MDLVLPGRVGERLIPHKVFFDSPWEIIEHFQIELQRIAERDHLLVSIEERVGRGYLVQWAPVDEPWPW